MSTNTKVVILKVILYLSLELLFPAVIILQSIVVMAMIGRIIFLGIAIPVITYEIIIHAYLLFMPRILKKQLEKREKHNQPTM